MCVCVLLFLFFALYSGFSKSFIDDKQAWKQGRVVAVLKNDSASSDDTITQ